MKTYSELENEARQLTVLAREQRRETGLAPSGRSQVVAPGARPLFTFPESTVRSNAASEYEGPLTHRMIRSIDAIQRAGRVEFRLVEEEFVSTSEGELVRHYDPVVLETDDDALEILTTGYRRLDEDRLRERIEPVIDRVEANTFPESATTEEIAEIEHLASDLSLSPAGRLRLRADAREMLEGRMEPGDFIARTVARQNVGEAHHERVEERHEMKLSITHV